jgi:hypothetical protein
VPGQLSVPNLEYTPGHATASGQQTCWARGRQTARHSCPVAAQAQQRYRERQRAKLQEANVEYDKLSEEVERLRLENQDLVKQVRPGPGRGYNLSLAGIRGGGASPNLCMAGIRGGGASPSCAAPRRLGTLRTEFKGPASWYFSQ